jgi:outer membrane immunogenic protein
MPVKDTASCTVGYPCCPGTGFTVSSSVDADWLLTARPRIGFAAQNWLFYATGGVAVTKIKAKWVFQDPYQPWLESASKSRNKVGWTAGVGIEVGLGNHFSIKSEYLYADFGKISSSGFMRNAAGVTPAFAANNPFSHSMELRTHTVRMGLNYKF